MVRALPASPDVRARFSFWSLVAFFVLLWIGGGASRADVLGQPILRSVAWLILIAFVLIAPRFDWRRVQPVLLVLACAIVVVALQLIPLPPSLWTALPGRAIFAGAADVSGQLQPWRPLSISPSGTVNALGALIVPLVILVLSANLSLEQHWRIAGLILALVFAGCVAAMMQTAGGTYGNPLINYQAGSVSGNFANRNHFALFVALGCLLAPVWGFHRGRRRKWTSIAGILVLPLFLLVILATGSRSGLALGVSAIFLGLVMVRKRMSEMLRSWPRRRVYIAAGIMLLGLLGPLVASVLLDRAVALNRAFDMQVSDDLRSRALPFVITGVERYFPVGAGFGTFDPVYRIEEPDALLQTAYFNHAHNDWLEVAMDGGIPGVAVMIVALSWVAVAARRVLASNREDVALGTLGLATLLLVMLASIADYPARTPMWMAIIALAAVWLQAGSQLASGQSDATQT